MAEKSQGQRLPGCLEAAIVLAGWDARSSGVTGSMLSFPCPLLSLAGGESPPRCLLAPCCPKPLLHVWLEHPAAGSSSSVPSRPGVFWGCHRGGWLLGSCQGAGHPRLCGLSPGQQGPPGRHLRSSYGNSWAGPSRTSHLALQPFPALPWLVARRHSMLPSLIARWLIAIPWPWTPTGVGCQG